MAPTPRLMSLNNPDRRRKQIKFFAQTVLQMSPERKMQTGLAAGREDNKSRRTHADLRHVLNVQTRTTMCLCRGDACPVPDFPVEEIIKTRSGNAGTPSFVGTNRERQ